MLALFERYPRLQETLPYAPLGQLPTPIQKLDRLGPDIGIASLYAKREDLSGKPYGGNKLRAVEFLLGEALRSGCKRTFTLGFPASCQALAQAIYTRQLGLQNFTILLKQPVSAQGKRHLLLYQHLGAELHPFPNLAPLLRHAAADRRMPKLIEAVMPLGMVGSVNAGLELSNQVAAGLLPEPDRIYISLAQMGTAAGLLLGLRAAGLKTRLTGVQAGHPMAKGPGKDTTRQNKRKLARLYAQTNRLLTRHDAAFPSLPWDEAGIEVSADAPRPTGRLMSESGQSAMRRLYETEGLQLDEMFTANVFAAFLTHAQQGRFAGQTVLWWNSYSSWDFSALIHDADYRLLPRAFHHFFEDQRSTTEPRSTQR